MSPALFIALQIIFWISVVAIIHSYVLYPLLVKILARRKSHNTFVHHPGDSDWPHLFVIMAAHNEEAVIANTLNSILSVDYPKDKLNIVIGSDNSTDRTHEILDRFRSAAPNLAFHIFEGRNGKIKVVNELIRRYQPRFEQIGDPVLILCDANVAWTPTLPAVLAQHFKNPTIGQVACNVLDCSSLHDGIAEEEEAYVNRENTIKYHEGLLWGRMMGAFGACYAMRSRLFEPVPDHYNVDDFYQTMRCFELGYDAIVEPRAVAYEVVSQDIREEFRRKSRISIGNFQNLSRFGKFLTAPWRCGFGTFFAFWSHKGIRWFGPFLLLAALISSALLSGHTYIHALAFAGICGTLFAAVIDGVLSWVANIHVKLFRFIRYFYLMNLALLMGGIKFLRGVKHSVWEPTQRVVTENRA